MVVGVKTKGKSNLKATTGIELKSCITYKELARYEIALIENCTKEDEDKVRDLIQSCKKVYSIGSIDAAISRITIPITSLSEIINEKTALLREKEKNAEEIKKADEAKREAEKKEFETSNENARLKTERARLTREAEIKDKKIEDLEKEIKETKKQLEGEKQAKEKAEQDLEDFKTTLGNTIIDNKVQLQNTTDELNKEHNKEIENIKLIIEQKEETIETQKGKITDLEEKVKELSKTGAIPEITYKYNGNAKIVSVFGQGSYGVSNLTYSIYKILRDKNKNVLLVDLDFKGGNLKKYIKKDSNNIENWIKNGGELVKTPIIKTMNANVDYVGGVNDCNIKPSDIYLLDFDKIFQGNYDYILVDGGIYGGYNIQTKICDMLINNGTVIYVHVGKELNVKNKDNIYNVENFNNEKGIPKQMQMYGTGQSLYDVALVKMMLEKECEQWLK